MWRGILTDAPFLDIVVKHWILPVAAGYFPTPYQQYLARGRLVALSKHPKPGIRPINITDSWRRIAAKTLLTTCLPDFNKFFQQGHRRGFQFSTAIPDGAATNCPQCFIFSMHSSMAMQHLVPHTFLQVGKTSHMLSRCKYIYSSGLLAKVGSGRRAADVPGHRDLSPAPHAQPEALVHCSCLVGEKSWKPQIRITTDR
jgi:hypothetical protein